MVFHESGKSGRGCRGVASVRHNGALDLTGNQGIPEGLTELTELRVLHLGGNRLTALPEALAQLTNLHYLDLSGNSLTPPSNLDVLTRLANLDTLNLDRNQLTEVPLSLAGLKNLVRLRLDGNPLTGEWREARHRGEALQHLRDRASPGPPTWYRRTRPDGP